MILWKNVWYNLVTRWWHLFKYYWKGLHNSEWWRFHYPNTKPWTKDQEAGLRKQFDRAVRDMKFNLPRLLDSVHCAIFHDPLIRFPERRSPCSPGCYYHRTHPCERCGRIGGILPTAQQLDTPRQGKQEDTDNKST